MSKSDVKEVEPGRSEEGATSGKSSEEKSKISETKDTLKGAESKNAVENDEVVVENSKKDKSVDSDASNQSKQASLRPHVSKDSLQTEKKEVLDSDELRKQKDLTDKISKDSPSVDGASNDSSFDSTSGEKVTLQSSAKQKTEPTRESTVVEDRDGRKAKPETANVSLNTTQTTTASAVSISIVDQEFDPDGKVEFKDKKTDLKANIEINETGEQTENDTRPASVEEQTDDLDTSNAQRQGFSPKSPESNYPVPLQRKKLTPEQLESLFVRETQEKMLGLIGAMLPKDSKVMTNLHL